ncbi:MAG TPA: choice-of-anchor tandem repeat GloVer-containing protein [Rhizomicrobium sp.]|jgi:uncharacterized repeat protein (TIGR03803 family)
MRTFFGMAGILFGALVLAGSNSAQAAKFHVLYEFQGGTDADGPIAGLIDGKKLRYGTTYYGGAGNFGTVYSLASDGTERVLYSFAGGSDGENPQAGLIADAKGNLYGTTYYGGPGQCGTVFKITPKGHETVLYAFKCSLDGKYTTAGLVMDAEGNLYGATYGGGLSNHGAIFKLAPEGAETVLYSFTGGDDGAYPAGTLITDKKGNFYGTTYNGGTADQGVVFKLSPKGKETALYAFQGGNDGATPFAGVILDGKGNIYGSTYAGGGSGCNGSGCGTVYSLAPDGTETVLHAFAGGSDGFGLQAGVAADSSGNLYGSTLYGGNTSACSGNGCGTVFRLAPDGTKTVLYEFAGNDGAQPSADFLAGKKGELIGTTYNGGNTGCGGFGCGVVFEIKE